jgi:hypothetical protein
MTIGGSDGARCGRTATGSGKNLANAYGNPYVELVLRSDRFRLALGFTGWVHGSRWNGCKSAEAAAENPNERAFARFFRRLPYQGFAV